MRKLNILLLSILVASVTGCGSKTEKTKKRGLALFFFMHFWFIIKTIMRYETRDTSSLEVTSIG